MHKSFLKSSFKLILTLLLGCLSFITHAGDHIFNRSYWQDETAQIKFDQAKNQTYKEFDGVLSRGYTQSAIWIKLAIAPSDGVDKLILRIRPIYLDEIILYDPLDTSGNVRKVGDTADYRNNEYSSLSHAFEISTSHETRDIWLRLKTNSTALINIEAFTLDEMRDSEFNLQLNYFGVLAIVAMFMFLVLLSWFNNREPLYAFFVVRQVYYFFYTAALFGLHRYFLADILSASDLDLLYSWLVVGATALSFGFEYKFLNEYSPPKWAKVILIALLAWSGCVILLLITGQVFNALKFNMLLNAVGVVTLLFLSLLIIDDKKSQQDSKPSLLKKNIIVSYYLFINLVLIFSLMPYLGFMKGNEFAVNGLVFYTLSSSFVITILMQLRASNIRKAQSTYEQQLLVSKKQIEFEKRRREEQSHMLHMLMHELKNPLAVIDMALLAKNDLQKTSGYVSRAVSNMKSILDRCVRADKLIEGSVVIQKEQVNINEFFQELLSAEDLKEKQVVLDISDCLRINTDVQFFEVICTNLIDNALRYGDSLVPVFVQGRAKLSVGNQQGASIIVSNRPGSASWPDADRVFTKYYRSPGAEAQSGTGLGLYLVRELARLLGGDCIYAPDEKNIRFELWLPN